MPKTLEEYARKIRDALNNQNFEPNDSQILSAIIHPVEAAKRAGNAFTRDVNTVMGASDLESANPLYGPSPDEQAKAALNLAGLAGTGTMPFNRSGPATLGTFAGMKSETAPRLNHLIAQDMEKAGHNPNDILQKTGWFRGGDNGLRYEISDHQARMKVPLDDILESPLFGKPTQTYTLGDILHHPELYKAYPELEKTPFVKRPGFLDFKQLQGWRGDNEIGLTPYATDPLGTLLHEAQHYVQEKEGFGLGGNASTVWGHVPESEKMAIATNAAQALTNKIDKHSAEISLAEQIKDHPAVNSGPAHDAVKAIFGKDYFDASPEQREAVFLARNPESYKFAIDKLQKMYADLAEVQSGDEKALLKHIDTHELYKRLHGETEARNTTERRLLTPEERRNKPAWETQEYPWNKQFVVKGKN